MTQRHYDAATFRLILAWATFRRGDISTQRHFDGQREASRQVISTVVDFDNKRRAMVILSRVFCMRYRSFPSIHFFMALRRFLEAKSNRGKLLLTNDGYEYTFEALSKVEDGWEYWRCPRRPPYCPGRATVLIRWQVDEDGTQYKEGRVTAAHNHPAILGTKMVRDANELLRKEAASDFPTTSRNIVRETRSNLPIDVRVGSAPSASNMAWNYNYQKRKHQEEAGDVGLDALPATAIVIPARLQNFVILDGNVDGGRIIVFCSNFGMQTLRNFRNEIAIDGTFESCPRGFAQLYTVSTIIDHCSVPCVYGLLPGKSLEVYRRFFEAIRLKRATSWATFRRGDIMTRRHYDAATFRRNDILTARPQA
ncbi:hypothetical protein niasHT_010062 [Heterodera trifolii]|uniref:FLYWCH-type domain-containing protein n=1 Tax=Heterodera trifolii TaxID=157864 RepID=A0ABD2LYW4_9BILA